MVGGASKTKKVKWLLILLSAVVVIIFGVAAWLLVRKTDSFQSDEKSIYGITSESKLAFHRYVNFLLKNEDSATKPELLNFLANDYYFLHPTAMFAERTKLDNPEFARTYFSNLNSIYEEFSRMFFLQTDEDGGSAAEEYSRYAISDYFFEASKGSYFGLSQILSIYIQNGEDYLRNMVEDALKSESDNETIKALLEARKKQIDLYIEAIYRSEQAGCIVEGSLDSNCAHPIFETIENESVNLASLINELEIELRTEAIATLEKIYYEFYPDENIIEEGKSK